MKDKNKTGYVAPDLELTKCSFEAIVCASLEQLSEEEHDFEWE